MLTPQPPAQVTAPAVPPKERLAAVPTPLVSNAVGSLAGIAGAVSVAGTAGVPLNSNFATRFASERLPPEATVPSFSLRALDNTSEVSTGATAMAPANLLTAASINAALPAQSAEPPAGIAQQLWCSSRRRTT